MKKAGLTGGIGSGKTVVAGIFKSLSIPIYNSDERAKALYFAEHVRVPVELLLGKETYLSESELNKVHISSKIFSDKKLLTALNAIIHPAVGADFEHWLKKQNAAFIIKESALMFEAGIYKNMDALITVTADLEIRISRVMKRDKLDREQVLARMSSQFPDAEKQKLSDYLVNNNDDELVIPQVLKIYDELRK
ncbi:MAG: dephospho-CoA kinase [Bacteroidia bacterium]